MFDVECSMFAFSCRSNSVLKNIFTSL